MKSPTPYVKSITTNIGLLRCAAHHRRRWIMRHSHTPIDEYDWQQWAKLSLNHLGLDRCRKGLIFSVAGSSLAK